MLIHDTNFVNIKSCIYLYLPKIYPKIKKR